MKYVECQTLARRSAWIAIVIATGVSTAACQRDDQASAGPTQAEVAENRTIEAVREPVEVASAERDGPTEVAAPPSPPEPGRDANAEREAIRAYRELIRAYNRGDAAGYFGSFTNPLQCFYGSENVPLSRLQKRRKLPPGPGDKGLREVELIAVHSTPTAVALIDWGVWSEGDMSPNGLHEKAILMRSVAGRWYVAGEVSSRLNGCMPGVFDGQEPSPRFARCRAAHGKCMAGCKKECRESGGEGNSCNLCPNRCLCAATACLGAAEDLCVDG